MSTTTLIEQIKDDLGYLKLYRSAEVFAALAEGDHQTDRLSFLAALVAQEAAATRQRRLNARLRFADFPARRTIEEFDFDFQPSIDRDVIADLAALDFVTAGTPILFLGKPGCGKSHLAVALGIRAVEAGYRGYFTSATDMVAAMTAAYADGTFVTRIRTYTGPSVLVIDDVGITPFDRAQANAFFQVGHGHGLRTVTQRSHLGVGRRCTMVKRSLCQAMFQVDADLLAALRRSTVSTPFRKAAAELLGSFVLVFFAVGSAVFGLDRIGALGVALAFGLTLLVLAYAIGPVSGCHVNPAVTLGVLLRRGISAREATMYWAAQVAGAAVAGALLKLMTSNFGGVTDQTGALGANDWGTRVNARGAFLFEVLGTFLLVLVVLLVTGRAAAPGFAGLAIGLVLAVIHLVGIPLDGTSVNPARSFGPALFSGANAMRHLWLFIVAPMVGATLAALVIPVLDVPDATAEVALGPDPTGVNVPA